MTQLRHLGELIQQQPPAAATTGRAGGKQDKSGAGTDLSSRSVGATELPHEQGGGVPLKSAGSIGTARTRRIGSSNLRGGGTLRIGMFIHMRLPELCASVQAWLLA